MKPRFQLRFLSVALFALGGRAGAESLPPFEVPAALLGRPDAVRSRKTPPAPEAPAVATPAVAAPVATPVAEPAATPVTTVPVAPLKAPAVPSPAAVGGAQAAVPAVTTFLPAPASAQPPVSAAVASRAGPAPASVKNGESVITADKVFGRQDFDVTAEGRAVLLRDGTRVEGDRLLPVRGRSCSSQAMPFVRQKFPTYDQFARATLKDIYGENYHAEIEALVADNSESRSTADQQVYEWATDVLFEVRKQRSEAKQPLKVPITKVSITADLAQVALMPQVEADLKAALRVLAFVEKV